MQREATWESNTRPLAELLDVLVIASYTRPLSLRP
jgi:hypothetical protein